MKFSLNHSDFNKQIKQMIQRAESSSKGVAGVASRTVKTLTRKLEEETVKRMPVDEAMLEKSIDTKVDKGKSFHDTWGYIWIPTNAPGSEYALWMHEMNYSLGERSQLKQTADPAVTVGRKYMERAMTENQRAFSLYILKKLKEFIDVK